MWKVTILDGFRSRGIKERIRLSLRSCVIFGIMQLLGWGFISPLLNLQTGGPSLFGYPRSEWLRRVHRIIRAELWYLLTYLLTYLLSFFLSCLLTCSLTRSLTNSLTPWCRTLFEKLIVIQLVKKYPPFFMEPESSLPCSQKPSIGPNPEPAKWQLLLIFLCLIQCCINCGSCVRGIIMNSEFRGMSTERIVAHFDHMSGVRKIMKSTRHSRIALNCFSEFMNSVCTYV
jgi:hypothetical protein